MTGTNPNTNPDPMGKAIADYWENKKCAHKLMVYSPDFEDDEFPVETLFRNVDQMPEVEASALKMAKGKILDVGAGAGCHSLALQDMGLMPDAIDISALSVATMKARGVRNAEERDFWTVSDKYDTILMLMNGTGIVGTVENFPNFFKHISSILANGGQLLIDSTDLCYLFENEDGSMDIPIGGRYYGEMDYTMKYGKTIGRPFPWLYVDFDTLAFHAEKSGFRAEMIAEGDHYDYLARITR